MSTARHWPDLRCIYLRASKPLHPDYTDHLLLRCFSTLLETTKRTKQQGYIYLLIHQSLTFPEVFMIWTATWMFICSGTILKFDVALWHIFITEEFWHMLPFSKEQNKLKCNLNSMLSFRFQKQLSLIISRKLLAPFFCVSCIFTNFFATIPILNTFYCEQKSMA